MTFILKLLKSQYQGDKLHNIIKLITWSFIGFMFLACGTSPSHLQGGRYEYSGAVGDTSISVKADQSLLNTEMTPLNGGVIIAWQADTPTHASVVIEFGEGLFEELTLEVKPGKAAIVVTKDRQVLRAGNVDGHRVFKCDSGSTLCMVAIPMIKGIPY